MSDQNTVSPEVSKKPVNNFSPWRRWIRKAREPAQVIAMLLLLATVAFVWVTRAETEKVIESATEDKLLPILVVEPVDDEKDPKMTKLAVRNLGFGPALNATSSVQQLGHNNPILCFNHRTAIGSNESENLRVGIGDNDLQCRTQNSYLVGDNHPNYTTPEGLAADTLSEPKTDTTPAKPAAPAKLSTEGANLCLTYQNVSGEWFVTWQKLSKLDKGGLGIDFLCAYRLPKDVHTCMAAKIPIGCRSN